MSIDANKFVSASIVGYGVRYAHDAQTVRSRKELAWHKAGYRRCAPIGGKPALNRAVRFGADGASLDRREIAEMVRELRRDLPAKRDGCGGNSGFRAKFRAVAKATLESGQNLAKPAQILGAGYLRFQNPGYGWLLSDSRIWRLGPMLWL